jgi:predicted 3-demethylubiquinone-9 3-methyltransferase (glyoxalase superfamily)
MQKITPNLWFDDQAEEAANFYVSIFKNSKIGDITRYGGSAAQMSGKPVGSVLTVTFYLEGQEFVALNGGPQFKFTEAISLCVNCDTQQEVDELWEKLTRDGGEPGPCGWLKDKYGVSWQVVPRVVYEMMLSPDPVKAERAMEAMLQMQKLDIAGLQQAYERG